MKRYLRLAAVVAGVTAVTTVLGACTSLPSSGPVPLNGLHLAPAQAQQGIDFVPEPPGAGWSAPDIVKGFVTASASPNDNFGIARKYLTSAFSGTWRPGWAATVVDPVPDVTILSLSSHVTGGPLAQVELTSKQEANLVASGSYAAGHLEVSSVPDLFKFVLVQVAGQWRIDGVDVNGNAAPQSLLLLTMPDFVRDYQARNLYFFPAKSAADVLIPDPVFIPQQVASAKAVEGLVTALFALHPTGWLSQATSTAFPVGTTKISFQVSGFKAVVNLGGTAARASPGQLRRMAAQLVMTLTSTSYSAPADIRSVEFLLNGKLWSPPDGQPLLLPKDPDFASWIPVGPASPLYYQAADAVVEPQVRAWTGGTATVPGDPPVTSPATTPVTLPKVPGDGAFGAIAVSPGTPRQAFFAGCRGKDVYIAPLLRGTPVVTQTLPVRCTSLSWQQGRDGQPSLWVPAGHEILRLAATGPSGETGQVVVVTPTMTDGIVTSLQVAPDGVRVAMIVHTRAGAQVKVAAISQTPSYTYLGQNSLVTVGANLADPVALSWLDPDDLLVLDQPPASAARLYVVPLDGGGTTQVITPAVATSVVTSVGASVSGVVVGMTETGQSAGRNQFQIWMSPGLNGPWHRFGTQDFSPVFPG